jgi:nicotinate-nucleotide pyrophosphorylase
VDPRAVPNATYRFAAERTLGAGFAAGGFHPVAQAGLAEEVTTRVNAHATCAIWSAIVGVDLSAHHSPLEVTVANLAQLERAVDLTVDVVLLFVYLLPVS